MSVLFSEMNDLKNDNLNINFEIGDYSVSILKFSYECQTWNIPSHSHSSNSYEIHYIPQGKGSLISGGKSYELCQNVLYTTGPSVEHEQISDLNDPVFEYCIYLKIEDSTKENKDNDSDLLKPFIECPFWYGVDSADLKSVLERIYREFLSPDTAAKLMLKALFMQFMVSMLRNYNHTSKSAIDSVPIPLVKAYILIEDSFLYEYDSITLEELARRLGVSSRQASRILYKRYGQNFTQKRLAARMAAAAVFLRETKLSITDISNRVGFSCPSHFHNAFKKYYNDTASHYRLKYSESTL